VKDASVNISIVSQLMNEKFRNQFVAEIQNEYEAIRQKYNQEENLLSFEEAKKRKPKLF